MIQRLPCNSCGDLIHPDTAAKNDGLCMPCKGGYREQIEEGKRQRARERELEKNPARVYWRGLVDRVYASESGYEHLQPEERTYFAVRCLIGEVFNGGFHLLFANSTGAMYAEMINGLMELEADQTLAMLTRAKELLFGPGQLPIDQEQRNILLPDIEVFERVMVERAAELNAIEKSFWSDPEQLDERCSQYAVAHGLYPAA